MRSNWQEAPNDMTAVHTAEPYAVSITDRGWITMSKRTWQNMGEPKAFQILFDHINSRIGLKPATLTTRNAYRVLPYTRSGGKKLHALRMIKEFGIVLPETLKFVRPEPDEDGILVCDMRTAKPNRRATSAYAQRLKQEAAERLAASLGIGLPLRERESGRG